MAQQTGTMITTDLVGKAEDVEDAIYDVSTRETPFIRLVGDEGTVKQRFHTWHVDKLRAPGVNAKPEGDLFTFSTAAQPTEQGNYLQIAHDTISVSGTAEEVKLYGRGKMKGGELARLRKKKAEELMLDVEHSCVGLNNSSVGTGTRESGSLTSFLKTNTIRGSGGSDGGYNSTSKITVAATDGTKRPFTETQVKDAQESAYKAGGHPKFIMLPTKLKRKFSGFSGIEGSHRQVHNVMADSKRQATILAAADIYIGDFGALAAVTNKFQRDRDVHLIDPMHICLAYLRRFKRVKLAKRADSDDEAMIVEFTLVNKNEAAHATIADLNNT